MKAMSFLMKLFKTRLGTLLLIMTMALPASADWIQQLAEASKDKLFVLPTPDETRQMETLFLRLFRGETGAAITSDLAKLDYDLREDSQSGLTLVVERPNARRGRGFFAFRKNGADALLQIPHAFKDEMTRDIGTALMQEGRFIAAAWNTVPRNFVANGDRVNADMAHLEDTYFIAFSRAFATQFPKGKVLQLHGFEQSKRRQDIAQVAAAILSNGTRTPPAEIPELADCLGKSTREHILSYPRDVRELGGTTNTIAAALRKAGNDGFYHLEMSRSFRSALIEHAEMRQKLLACFGVSQ